MKRISSRRGAPRGFSLVEVSIVSGLMALLAVLFIASMLALIGGYLSFLREIFLATHSLRFGGPHAH